MDDVRGPEPRFPDLSKQALDAVIDQLVRSAEGVKLAQGRLRALLNAVETVTGDLALESVLQNVIEAACDLTQARYGALGIMVPNGTLERFVYAGVSAETAARIGHLPEGKGLLAAPANDPRPLRLRNLHDDPRSIGFPPHHPPMSSFLGVPVHVRSEIFGSLYLTESRNGEFSEEDEELAVALAGAAGTAISNARLYQDARQQQRWLEASIEIGAQMLPEDAGPPMKLIARRAKEIADADLVSVSLLTADGDRLRVAAADGVSANQLVGQRYPVEGTLGGRVVTLGTPVLREHAVVGEDLPSHIAAVLDTGPLMVLPLRSSGPPRGVLSVLRRRGRQPFSVTEMAMAAGFASHASVALELADSRAAERRIAVLEDRDRIAMDLHDHVIQELFAIGLGMEGIAAELGAEHPLAAKVERGVDGIDSTIRRIRTTIYQLRGDLVTVDGGLRARLLDLVEELAPSLPSAPHVSFAGLVDERLDGELVEDIVAVVREALTNVAKHADACRASVDVIATAEAIAVAVGDDGVGPGGSRSIGGTARLHESAARWNGSFDLAPGPDGGTVATWRARLP